MTNPIVITNVTQTVAPAPSTLQQSGAFISQGGTTLAAGNYSLITQMSTLTALLEPSLAVTSITWVGGVATVTTAVAHGITSGDTFLTTIAGATSVAYNGTVLATVTGASTFTYPLVSDDGTSPATGTITYTPRNVAELVAMGTTFFAQGANTSVYVLELGAGEPAAGVTALTNFITANPGTFYAYLVPRNWDSIASFLALAVSLNGTTAKTYFYTTTTVANYANYLATMKSIYWLVEAPSIPPTEFSVASPFWDLLNTQPSNTNRVAPFSYRYAYGVTAYPTFGNSALLTLINNANGNYIATGAEGGISNTIVYGGQYADGNPINYWYAADWAQITVDLNVSNAVINGSNNPINPLYFNQQGINRLQQVAANTMLSGITFGMVLNPVVQTGLDGNALANALDAGTYDYNTVVNAVPFIAYTTANPGDYSIGKYAGFSISFSPLLGFTQITFNINVSNFA